MLLSGGMSVGHDGPPGPVLLGGGGLLADLVRGPGERLVVPAGQVVDQAERAEGRLGPGAREHGDDHVGCVLGDAPDAVLRDHVGVVGVGLARVDDHRNALRLGSAETVQVDSHLSAVAAHDVLLGVGRRLADSGRDEGVRGRGQLDEVLARLPILRGVVELHGLFEEAHELRMVLHLVTDGLRVESGEVVRDGELDRHAFSLLARWDSAKYSHYYPQINKVKTSLNTC